MSKEEARQEIETLVSAMAKALVNNPEMITVNVVMGQTVILVEVGAAPEDVGQLIGKQGVLVDSMRNILSALGRRLRYQSVQLSVAQPQQQPQVETFRRAR